MTPLLCEEASAPLSDSIAPVQPLLARPDIVQRSPLAKDRSEQERLAAWRSRHQWQALPLQPYSVGRDEVWSMLCDVDVPLQDQRSPVLDFSHARKLLFVCASSAADLQGDVLALIEAADAWADAHISRAQTHAALDLARLIRHEATVNRARLRPADRRSESGNTASPVFEASYLTMLSAALRGAASLEQMLWEIKLAQGWALIHGWWIMEGHATLWLDKECSKTGRWLAEFRQKYQRR